MRRQTSLRILLIAFFMISVLSCDQNKPKILEEVEQQALELKIKRFDREFALSKPTDLESLKLGYPYFFNATTTDELLIAKMNDSLQQVINQEVAAEFPDFKEEQERLERMFKYIQHYFKAFKKPSIITLAETVDYKNKVIVTDTLLLISLDNYLGDSHKFYSSFPDYIRKFQDTNYLLSDAAEAYAKQSTYSPLNRQFMSYMIYYGKLLYFKDVVIPFESDAVKIRYTEKQLTWAEENEDKIWSYFIDKEYLFSTQPQLRERFINLAPFSKFYLELDNDSSPRIGQYIGWQIVRDFMENNPEITPAQLMRMPAKEIFEQSNYKP